MRPFRVATALVLGFAGFTMANAVDHGITHAWPSWQRAVWVTAILVLILSAVLLAANGLGLLTTATLGAGYTDELPAGRRLTAATFVSVYAGSLAGILTAGVIFEHRFGIPAERTGAALCGALFLLAATGRPWWLYQTFRRLGWFSAIPGPTGIRIVLAVLGAVLLTVGLIAYLG